MWDDVLLVVVQAGSSTTTDKTTARRTKLTTLFTFGTARSCLAIQINEDLIFIDLRHIYPNISVRNDMNMGLYSFAKRSLTRRVGVEHRQLYATTESVLGGIQAECPLCLKGRLAADPVDPELRTCDAPECGASFTLAELARAHVVSRPHPEEIVTRERRQAMTLLVAAQILIVAAAAWAVWTRSWQTLGGSVLLALVLCATAVVSRYRAWQIENGRLFETRAPLSDFLRSEVATLFGRR